jgi:hypothetical protein
MVAFTTIDIVGFIAAGATLAAFVQRTMVPMRVLAIAANLFFLGYALLGGLMSVLVLHMVLLPLNGLRLVTALRDERAPRRAAPARAGARGACRAEFRCHSPVAPHARPSAAPSTV